MEERGRRRSRKEEREGAGGRDETVKTGSTRGGVKVNQENEPGWESRCKQLEVMEELARIRIVDDHVQLVGRLEGIV
jgi:hypothetical protein